MKDTFHLISSSFLINIKYDLKYNLLRNNFKNEVLKLIITIENFFNTKNKNDIQLMKRNKNITIYFAIILERINQ